MSDVTIPRQRSDAEVTGDVAAVGLEQVAPTPSQLARAVWEWGALCADVDVEPVPLLVAGRDSIGLAAAGNAVLMLTPETIAGPRDLRREAMAHELGHLVLGHLHDRRVERVYAAARYAMGFVCRAGLVFAGVFALGWIPGYSARTALIVAAFGLVAWLVTTALHAAHDRRQELAADLYAASHTTVALERPAPLPGLELTPSAAFAIDLMERIPWPWAHHPTPAKRRRATARAAAEARTTKR